MLLVFDGVSLLQSTACRLAGEPSVSAALTVSGFFRLIKCVISVGLLLAVSGFEDDADEDAPPADDDDVPAPSLDDSVGFIIFASSCLTSSMDCGWTK
jgi:hypothetical protein